jgi:hypothetical protein
MDDDLLHRAIDDLPEPPHGEHPLDAARGFIAGALIGLGTWAALIGLGILVWRFLL